MNEDDVWSGMDDEHFLAVDLETIEKSYASIRHGCGIPSALPITNQSTELCKNFEMKSKLSAVTSLTSRVRPTVRIGKKFLKKNIPLQKYRYGRIWVSDIAAQLWCEQQMLFKFEPPQEMVDTEIVEREVVTVGTSLHLARELEIQDVITVRAITKEDRFAVKAINLLDATMALLNGTVPKRREIPVFGAPFGLNVFVVGVIDEITCNSENLEFGIVEFKTRATKNLPSSAQSRTHNLQVMLYKKLLDDITQNMLTKYVIARHLNLNLHKKFGRSVQLHSKHYNVNTLDQLLDLLFERLQAVPYISSLLVEYAFQADSSTIGIQQVSYDENWLYSQLKHSFAFWNGQREVGGVEIEDIWKCDTCPYNEVCVWRINLIKKFPEYVEDCKEESNVKVAES